MTEVRFYHLTRKRLEQVLPELLEKTLERGQRAVVMADSDDRVEHLTSHLWIYKPEGFMPHGNAKDGHAEQQPIWLTSADERPNNAAFLFLTDGAKTNQPEEYERICDIFDGNDDDAVTAARQRWGVYKAAGHNLSYWQQGDKGWEDKTPK